MRPTWPSAKTPLNIALQWLLLIGCHCPARSFTESSHSCGILEHRPRGYPGSVIRFLSIDESTTDVGPVSSTTDDDADSRHRRWTHPFNPAVGKVVACSTSKETTDCVERFILPGYRVAELGSQLRDVSSSICEAVSVRRTGDDAQPVHGHATLVDVVRRFPKNRKDVTRTNAMRQRNAEDGFYPEVSTFREIGCLDDWREALFPLQHMRPSIGHNMVDRTTQQSTPAGSGPPYDALVLDVNSIVGNDLEWTALSIIREFRALNGRNRPVVVLVRSLALNRWAVRLLHGSVVVKNNGISTTVPLPHVIATRGVQEYRDTIPFVVQQGDAVLEVGCHFGTSTVLLHEAAMNGMPAADGDEDSDGTDMPTTAKGYCIGVDVGGRIIRKAQCKHPRVFFSVGNAWKTAELLRTQQRFIDRMLADVQGEKTTVPTRVGFDVVYIDVGGLSGSDGLLEAISLISSIRHALEPRCIVIKSLCMRRLSSSLVPAWDMMKRKPR